jgi:hypothetical protein
MSLNAHKYFAAAHKENKEHVNCSNRERSMSVGRGRPITVCSGFVRGRSMLVKDFHKRPARG